MEQHSLPGYRHKYCGWRGMNTTISIPDGHLKAADRLAKELGISRNELFRKAIELYLIYGNPEVAPVGAGSNPRKDPKW